MHLGAESDIATIGVTHRPLVAWGEWPIDQRGAMSPLRIGESGGRLLVVDSAGCAAAGGAILAGASIWVRRRW
jgi:hypothetical protein